MPQSTFSRLRVSVTCDDESLAIRYDRVQGVTKHALRRHGCRDARIDVALVDAREMARLNTSFHHQSGATDVLTFELSEHADVVEGQIVVCIAVAAQEARRRGHSVEIEVLLYIVHGVLHLLGYDDHELKNARIMHEEEDRILESMGIGPVFAAMSD